jgi:hypothetical protein
MPDKFTPFSMKIDNRNFIPGRGAVVTGKITYGSIKLNDSVILIPDSLEKNLKILSIEKGNKPANEAKEGDEVNLLLGNVKQDEIVFFKESTLAKKGTEEWEEKKFCEWQRLREEFGKVKKEKAYQKVIDVAYLIIGLSDEAKFIGILEAIFQKEIGNAYLNLEQKDKAIPHFKAALAGFKTEHEKNKADKPNNWIKDINQLEKTLAKLQSE